MVVDRGVWWGWGTILWMLLVVFENKTMSEKMGVRSWEREIGSEKLGVKSWE